MNKKRSVIKILYKIGVTFVYLAMIFVLCAQALTPGNESSDISNSVGDTIDKVITEIHKPEAERIPVTDLTVHSLLVGGQTLPIEDTVHISAGESGQLQCSVSPENASDKSLQFTSSNPSIVNVRSDGTFEALTTGSAWITITSQDNTDVTKSFTIEVDDILLTGLELTLTQTDFYPNKLYGTTLTYSPENTTQREVSYLSSNENVLTIDENGNIKTHNLGEATITVVSVANGNITDRVNVIVMEEPLPEQIPVTSVAITSVNGLHTDNTLELGASATLITEVLPSDASNKALSYQSSNTDVITVNSVGKLTAKGIGTALITVASQEDPLIFHTIEITVIEIPLESVTISVKPDSLYVGESKNLNVAYTPTNTSQKEIIWTSSDPGKLTITSSGKITGVAAGTVTVTATSKVNQEIKDSFTITVEEKPNLPEIAITAVNITNKTDVGYVGKSLSLSAAVTPSNATYQTVLWESSNKEIATVANGKVTFLKAGVVTIYVKATINESISDSVTITVKEVLSSKITLKQEGLAEEEGGYTIKITVSAKISAVLDADATVSNVVFSSSNPEIVTISNDGTLQALQRGTVTITASTSYEGKTTSESFTLTVINLTPDVESITLTSEQEYGYVGTSITLSATINPIDAVDSLIWESSNPQIATVTQNGNVTYHQAGTVTITAISSSYDVNGSILITVKEVLSQNIVLILDDFSQTEDGYSLKSASSGKIFALLDENATVKTLQFTSSDPEIATIGQDGVISAMKAGTVTITVSCTYEGETVSESFELTVIGYSFKDTIQNFYYWIRKGIGHFGAFFALGIAAALTYHTLFPKSTKGKVFAFVVCIVAGFAVASITEIFQLPIFTEGRYCSFEDVLLDFVGYCCSTIPIFLFIFLVHFIKLAVKKAKKETVVEGIEPTTEKPHDEEEDWEVVMEIDIFEE